MEEKIYKNGESNNCHIIEYKNWYIFQGVILIFTGFIAIIMPSVIALTFELFLGILLLVSGIVQGVTCIKSKATWSFYLSPLLCFIIALLMIFNPLKGAIAISMILAVFLIIEGIIELFISIQFRTFKNWIFLLLSGIISVTLGIMILTNPKLGILFLGVLIGLNLISYGISMLSISIGAKKELS